MNKSTGKQNPETNPSGQGRELPLQHDKYLPGYPFNRTHPGFSSPRFAGGRSRLGGCPRASGGVGDTARGRLVAIRSW